MSLKNFLLESIQDTNINESYDEGEDMLNGFKKLSKKTRNLDPKAINKYIPSNELKPWMGECISMYVGRLIDSADAALSDEYEDDKAGFFEDEWSNIATLEEFEIDAVCEESKYLSDDVSDDEITDAIEKWLPYIYKKINGSDIEIPY